MRLVFSMAIFAVIVLLFSSCLDSDNEDSGELVFSINNSLTVAEGGTGTISSAQLSVSMTEDEDATPYFILVSGPNHGVLTRDEVELKAYEGIWMPHINNGAFKYIHDGSNSTLDTVVFHVSNGVNTVKSQEFIIAITPDISDDTLHISTSYTGPLYSGNFYSGFLPKTTSALWITDSAGAFVKTLSVSNGIVKIGKYGAHTYQLPDWTTAAEPGLDGLTVEDDSLAYIPDAFDGITAASVSLNAESEAEVISHSWDFTNAAGEKVAEGKYHIVFEAGNIQKDSVESGYPPVTPVNEKSIGTVYYGGSGMITAGTPTANIKSLTAELN